MLYIKKLFSSFMTSTFLLTNAFCFGELQEANSSFANQNIDMLHDRAGSELQTAIRPPQWSNNRLAFTFDASQETEASGTFTGYVTMPNQARISVNGIIGSNGYPVTLEISPPSLLGTYTMTFVVSPGLSGFISNAEGPFGTAQNLTNGDIMQTTFNVHNVGDQQSAGFLNRQ